MTIVALTNEQREFLLSEALDHEEYALRDTHSDFTLRDLAERALLIARLQDFAEGTAALEDEDRVALRAILRKHAKDATESAEADEHGLPRTEAGDPGYIYEGHTAQESVEMLKGYIARERREATMCEAILALLDDAREEVTA